MIGWFLGNLQAVIGALELCGFALIGIFAFTGLWSGKDNDRRTESDKVADGLIGRLQKTVDQNATDMSAMNVRIDSQQREIHILQGQNDAYLKIITLRDPAVKKIFDDAPEIHQLIRDTNNVAHSQLEATKNLTVAMEQFINRLPPLMPVMTP